MATATQERWMRLIELLNSDEFGYPSSWFEAADGTRSLLMACRTPTAQHVPADAHRMRIDGETWVRGDDWDREDIQAIYLGLQQHPAYVAAIRGGSLFIELAPAG
ncbi:MAG: hypothetical protein ACRC33_28810 [Gemmataceae bacterium]